jgi:hypothetical protein
VNRYEGSFVAVEGNNKMLANLRKRSTVRKKAQAGGRAIADYARWSDRVQIGCW